MKAILPMICACCTTWYCYGQAAFLLSSGQDTRSPCPAALNSLNPLVFSFVLKMNKEDVEPVINSISEQLARFGTIEKKEIFTSEGVDFAPLSHPSLQFLIEQLVDQEGKPLPVLEARLTLSSVVQIMANKELCSTGLRRWSICMESKGQSVQTAVQQMLSPLLAQFITDYQLANDKTNKPIFYIVYDASWWAPQFRPSASH